jgi:Cell wall-active antibiotics response 4TMS YvqF/Domain of unknown function (DUF1707)
MPPDEKPPTNPLALRDAREQAVAQLSDAFAHDLIEVDEFERRLTVAHRADTVSDVEKTVIDLRAAAPSTALVPARTPPLALANERQTASLLAIFGGVERHGPWTLPRRLQAFAIMGGIVLDFREALLLPGVTEIHVLALLGGAQIIVPPGLSVEVSGTAIMGGFGHVERIPQQLDPERPVLRVHGLAIMGGVAVETRLPGESEAEAHRRRRRDRRERRELAGASERQALAGASDRRELAGANDGSALGDEPPRLPEKTRR